MSATPFDYNIWPPNIGDIYIDVSLGIPCSNPGMNFAVEKLFLLAFTSSSVSLKRHQQQLGEKNTSYGQNYAAKPEVVLYNWPQAGCLVAVLELCVIEFCVIEFWVATRKHTQSR